MRGLLATANDTRFKRLLTGAREWLLPSRSLERRAWPALLGLAYIAAIGILGGLRSDHVFIGLLGLLDLYNEKTRLFLRYFYPFILTGVIYDSMRYFYWPGIEGRVHVGEPYRLERAWFGIGGLTPNEFFRIHHWEILDVFCGLAYLIYVGEYLLTAFLLFFRERFAALRWMAWSFLVVNVLGFATYFVYPAAPPWYVSRFGLGPARMDIKPFPAAAHRFDLIFGTHFFDQLYGKGVDVFGALPSLHVAYPFLVVCATFAIRELRLLRIPALLFFLLMCLSAVYLQHHYVLDVLLGTAYAAVTWSLVRRLLGRPGRTEGDEARLGLDHGSDGVRGRQSGAPAPRSGVRASLPGARRLGPSQPPQSPGGAGHRR